MELRDLFVASVALAMGGMMLSAAILDRGWCFQLRISQKIEETRGRAKARTFIGSVGTLLALLGLYIVVAPLVASNLFQSTDTDNPSNDQRTGTVNLAEAD